jgi:hypothetical protein
MEVLTMRGPTPSTRSRARSWSAVLMLGVCSFAGFVLPARGQTAPDAVEYRIKAAYLYNFTKFIEWPPQAYAGDGSPFLLGVVDPDGTAANVIEQVLRGKTTGAGRRIEVVRLMQIDQAALACHQIFITRAAAVRPADVRELVQSSPVLVVGETDGFAEHGGVIGLVLVGDRVRCEINLAGAERAGLKLSGRLAGVARLVREAPRKM